MSAIKSILLKGDFKTTPLIYRPCPNSEFAQGAWNISLNSLTYECEDQNYTSHCSINCNFVRGQKFSTAEDSVLTYNLPLSLFLLESGTKTVHTG